MLSITTSKIPTSPASELPDTKTIAFGYESFKAGYTHLDFPLRLEFFYNLLFNSI